MNRRDALVVLKAAKQWMKPGELAAFICDVSDGLYGTGQVRRTEEAQKEYESFWIDAAAVRKEGGK